jgi:hypothetical protein
MDGRFAVAPPRPASLALTATAVWQPRTGCPRAARHALGDNQSRQAKNASARTGSANPTIIAPEGWPSPLEWGVQAPATARRNRCHPGPNSTGHDQRAHVTSVCSPLLPKEAKFTGLVWDRVWHTAHVRGSLLDRASVHTERRGFTTWAGRPGTSGLVCAYEVGSHPERRQAPTQARELLPETTTRGLRGPGRVHRSACLPCL